LPSVVKDILRQFLEIIINPSQSSHPICFWRLDDGSKRDLVGKRIRGMALIAVWRPCTYFLECSSEMKLYVWHS
jgi:hypothetical protein